MRLDTTAIVRDSFAALWPVRFDPAQLEEHVLLGEGGLDLDSIEIVELVLECESRLGRPLEGVEEMLEAGPVTVGQLIEHLSQA